MRRLALVAATAVLPLLAAAPAFAVDNVICVNFAVGTCSGTPAATITAAITAANANTVDDTILVAPGTYSDGPYTLGGTIHALTLKGSGQGSTILTLPASANLQTYVTANSATVRDLTIQMTSGSITNDTGLTLNAGTADHVTVDGTGTHNATGVRATSASISASTITMPVTAAFGGRAVLGGGDAIVSDSTLTGFQGFVHGGATTTDTLSRLRIRADYQGVATDGGSITVDDTVIDLGPSSGTDAGTALAATNFNQSSADKAINANHVTIVGGGAGSKGAWAYAAASTVTQHSTIQLDNSIVRGPATSLVTDASNNGGPLAASNATINVSYSDWTSSGGTIGSNGAGGVVAGAGNLNVDPVFANPTGGDYRLTAGSPVVDHGSTAGGGPALDLGRNPRVTDGDGNGVAVRDLGAYELSGVTVGDTTAPATGFTSKPAKHVSKRKVSFRFSASENAVTFSCKLDRRAWHACTSPSKFRVKVGKHRFSVRATDATGNTDATPATYRFKRVR